MVSAGMLLAYSGYTGFSGAPASNGTCSSSCHAQNDFTPTCEISGFPETYTPNQQYTIVVRHNGGSSIDQFNCSIRFDYDSTAAGVISADDGTEVYSITNETNGVHWLSANTDTGTFVWTAPDTGTGYVTLYWAGLQGIRSNGADQQIVIQSVELGNSIDYTPDLPQQFTLNQNYPNPFNNATTISFQISSPGDVILEISNILGQNIYTFSISDARPGHYKIYWNGTDISGSNMPSGLYFYQLLTPEGNLTRKMAIIR